MADGMLRGLDDVDWAGLQHAYGSAGDVPVQIRALLSAEQKVRDRAIWELNGNIFHQGTRYEATPHAVPFLLEVLAWPGCECRAELIVLLASIAIGYEEAWLPEPFPVAELRAKAEGGARLMAAVPQARDYGSDDDYGDAVYQHHESLSEEESESLYAYEGLECYDAVAAGLPQVRALLADPAPPVRALAANLLAWFPEAAEGSVPALRALTADPDESAAATAIVALGLLGEAPAAGLPSGGSPLVRWASAVALAAVHGRDAGPGVAGELEKWADEITTATVSTPFLDGDTAAYAGHAFDQVVLGPPA
ncbi:HEAT repeat domain-containing protein [Longispora albida]|uniref:HEAT repeat domain-containing protein n=1 Tax=Longispora albida TaxID=203523 RepID=UPI0012F96C95|nr:HEAT repeat domain-containing protein [Longispora albida]